VSVLGQSAAFRARFRREDGGFFSMIFSVQVEHLEVRRAARCRVVEERTEGSRKKRGEHEWTIVAASGARTAPRSSIRAPRPTFK
jgi:hypothetical protein